MSEHKWTAGPWRVNGSLPGPTCDECGADTISDDIGIWSKSAPIAAAIMDARQESNAHVIAAAPELFEALEAACEWDGQDMEGVDAVWLDRARAALAKAKGEEV